MTLFALQHTSGIFMPDFTGRAGGTYVDPFKYKGPPRLFTTARGAKNALTWWARGMVRMSSNKDWETGLDDGAGIASQVAVEGRNVDDWKVVPIAVVVVEELLLDMETHSTEPLTGELPWNYPVASMSDEVMRSQYAKHCAKIDEFEAAPDEDKAHGGSPGEWMYERVMEFDTEAAKRGITFDKHDQ